MKLVSQKRLNKSELKRIMQETEFEINSFGIKKFAKELNGNRVEGELIKTVIISLITSVISLGALYFMKLRFIEGIMPKYGLFLFLSIIGFASVVPAIRQVRAYKFFPCMSGMMIGMTIGMMSGFLAGFYIGATNGMFWGSVYGMAVGIALGAWNGKCCGVMGVMEGLMAGFMGGLMGAMTAVMILNDNLRVGAVIVFAVCATILFGLNYMIYKETASEERQHKEDYFVTVVISFVLTVTTVWFMVFGPRSLLFQ